MNLQELKKTTAYTEEEFRWTEKVILVAEDVELNFMYINELLEPTGAIIIRAENGKKAVDYCLSNTKIDMVLMDILMPVMNGYEATRQIKAVRKELPIIAQTAYALTEDRGKALAAGCDDFIAKPIGREELLRKINAFFKIPQTS
jgi:CheY-like chemotaxis protein